jgi:hypothetical protein
VTIRLLLVLTYALAAQVLFIWSLVDARRRRTLILYAIWFALLEIGQVLNAIAVHTGAFPLWNNK